MIRVALAIAVVGWMVTFARRLVAPFLPGARDSLTVALTAAGVGVGIMTLLAFWVMLAIPGAPALSMAFGVSAVLFLAAASLLPRTSVTPRLDASTTETQVGWLADPLSVALEAAILFSCVGILFNAVSWPFEVGDALALYAPFGKHIYETATLPIGDRLYPAYPMLVPIGYAFTHWAAGSPNEYLARLVPGLMAVCAIGVAGTLGKDMGSRHTGLAAAALVALTPAFGRWASSGYADVPAALYVGLTALFAWRWWTSGDSRALVLCGVSAGLACWTKNSALTLLPSLAALVVARHWPGVTGVPSADRHSVWRSLVTLGGPVLLTAGPWYARNLLVFGFIVPPTAFVDRAQHTTGSLAIMLRADQHFGMPGWLFTVALVHGLVAMFRSTGSRSRWFLLLVVALPFLSAWWWFASYDARFLMTILPVLAVMAALMLDDLTEALRENASPPLIRAAMMAATAVTVIAIPVALRKTVEHKRVLLQNPFLDDAGRHRVRLGGLYDLAAAINQLPAGSRIAGAPAMIRFHLSSSRLESIDGTVISGPPESVADRYDFVVYRTGPSAPLPWSKARQPVLQSGDEYVLLGTRPSKTEPAEDGR
jgi:hypothetical protein